MPSGHGLHDELAGESWNCPRGQGAQGARPSGDEEPVGQGVRHEDGDWDPTTAVVDPAGQAVQKVAAEAAEYVPTGQSAQGARPVAEKEPAEQRPGGR